MIETYTTPAVGFYDGSVECNMDFSHTRDVVVSVVGVVDEVIQIGIDQAYGRG